MRAERDRRGPGASGLTGEGLARCDLQSEFDVDRLRGHADPLRRLAQCRRGVQSEAMQQLRDGRSDGRQTPQQEFAADLHMPSKQCRLPTGFEKDTLERFALRKTAGVWQVGWFP